MSRILCVAEKPSVAKELAHILSSGYPQSIRTHSPFNSKFEFEYDLNGQRCFLIVTSVTGHLMQQDFPEGLQKWGQIDPARLLDLDIPVLKTVPDDKKNLERTLIEEARRCSQLICFLDCDREGENISFEVIDTCRKGNRNIIARRARFSALIPRDIHQAMRSLRDPDKRTSDAVDARQEIDLRLGAAFTRFQTKCLGRCFEDTLDKLISWGPCQFATLGFVVDRAWQIERFVSEEFWKIHLSVVKEGFTTTFEWSRGVLFDRAACTILYEMCSDEPTVFVVGVQEREKRKWRPLPLNTVALQTLASRKLGIASDMVMTLAEDLYNKGIISYPRTETENFKEGTDLNDLIRKQTMSPVWGHFAGRLVDGNEFLWPRAGTQDDQAHPPIHPLQFVGDLTGPSQRLYELICRHFLACCARDAVGAETVVTVEVGPETFTCKGLMIRALNYLEVYVYERWVDQNIPVFIVGEQFRPSELRMIVGSTRPPPLLSEADLISLMDRHGIGTDATIAQHISTIQQREYSQKDAQQRFHPTPLGLALVTGYEAIGIELARPHFRAKMEQDMGAIAAGQRTCQEVIEAWMRVMKPIFLDCVRKKGALVSEMGRFFNQVDVQRWQFVGRLSRCGTCNNVMDLRRKISARNPGTEDRMLFCSTCRQSYNLPRGTVSAHQHVCPECNFQVINVLNQETSRQHTICPYCFSNPPSSAVSADIGTFQNGFRCFDCMDQRCQLAKKPGVGEFVRPCFVCSKRMILRKSKRSFYLACEGYPACKATVWLPGGSDAAITPAEGTCPLCLTTPPVRLLTFQFKRGTVPPDVPLQHTGCIGGCDSILRDLLEQDNHNASRMYVSQGSPQVQIHNRLTPPTIRGPSRSSHVAASSNLNGDNDAASLSSLSQSYNALMEGLNVGEALDQFLSTPATSKTSRVSHATTSSGGVSRVGGTPSGHTSSDVVCSGHGLPCKLLTVRKEGPNQGRQFYKCSVSAPDECNFFQWQDEPAGGGSGIGRAFDSAGGRAGPTPTNGPAGACFRCGQPGHFSRDCPNSSAGSGSAGRPSSFPTTRASAPSPAAASGGACFRCGRTGHFSRDCPSLGVGGVASTGGVPAGQSGAGGRGRPARGGRGVGQGFER